ncbi:sodium-dependent bicarbonate transport family permease [Marinobacter caseinilyticus]|uniref:sodium-dependent bicarbonate transport family permease n=1 Tax=Marinobacter caseinilyticus TaxID=2692195 RepID=UPI00140887EA|nr:sodium-dependent bicarbonate transport family permease [Marinobacter caseinilyticus]
MVVLAVITDSVSCTAASVAIRCAIPAADIGLTRLVFSGVTFPFNVLVGSGLYRQFMAVRVR